jgi:hypothetical protein
LDRARAVEALAALASGNPEGWRLAVEVLGDVAGRAEEAAPVGKAVGRGRR